MNKDNLFKEFYYSLSNLEELTLDQSINCITHTEFNLINNLKEKEITMNELADILNITMGTATVAINKLLKKGFVIRKKDEIDKRQVLVSLSKKGLKVKEFNEEFSRIINDTIYNNLSNDEIENFNKTFKKIVLNLKNMEKEYSPKKLNEFKVKDIIKIKFITNKEAKSELLKIGVDVKTILQIVKKDDKNIYFKYFNKEYTINNKLCKYIIATKKLENEGR